VTPKNNPGNFVSPTLIFFFVFACFHLSNAPSFSTHTPLLKLPCPSQKDTRETAGSIRAGKNKSGLCHVKTHRPRKRPRRELWQGCNEQRTCGVVLKKLSMRGPTSPRREHQSGELCTGRFGWGIPARAVSSMTWWVQTPKHTGLKMLYQLCPQGAWLCLCSWMVNFAAREKTGCKG
jgi:hypothetical protein